MTLVVLPGMGCSPRMWTGALPAGVPVHHARIDAPSLDACVDDVLAGLPPVCDLVGLSLGGIVAMALVRRAPRRVRRLCLVATSALPPTEKQYPTWAGMRHRLADGAPARDLQRDLLPVLLSGGADSPHADIALDMADDVGAAALDAQLALQATRVDERPALADIAVPTLVLAPEHDRLCPVERHREIHALVPGSRLVVLAGVAHLAPLEVPEQVARYLGEWLATPA